MRGQMPRRRKSPKIDHNVSECQLDLFTSVNYNVDTGAKGVAAPMAPSQSREVTSTMTTTYDTRPDSPMQVGQADEIQQPKRPTYPQNWPSYNAAQTAEKDLFKSLLADLCACVEQPAYSFGRPRFPLADMVYAGATKVYSGFSARRFDCDVREAYTRGFIGAAPSFNSVNRYIANPYLTPIITDLIQRSAGPLRLVESAFAANASGFSTCRFERWYDAKWGKEKSQRQWLKAHIVTGVKTNIVTAIEVTPGNVHDSPMLKPLLDTTAERFTMAEVSADKAYLSDANLRHIKQHGADPYIPFKSNTTGKGSAMWRRLYAYFMLHEEEWKGYYHKRSNVETTFSMVKVKFGEALRSKSDTGQTNEILLKFLCNNIYVLIQEMYTLGISVDFSEPEPTLDKGWDIC